MSMFALAIFSLWSFHGPASDAYKQKTERQTPENGYSVIRYDLNHHNYSIPLKVPKNAGCIITFSQPYDDSWASDAQGSGSGEYYKYAEFGTDATGAPNYQKMIISSVLPTKTTQNLFVLIEGKVIEFTLAQADAFEKADRKVVINFVGLNTTKPRPKKSMKPIVPESQVLQLMEQVSSEQNRRQKVPHGHLIYKFEKGHNFVYFTPKEGTPPIEILEIVRGKKRGTSFKYEIPIASTQQHEVGRSHLMTFNNFELEKGERIYFRIKVKGERTAKAKRLRKRGV